MRKWMIFAFAVVFSGTASAADVVKHKRVVVQQPPEVVYVQPEPLRQIPIVGTVVYGGLSYAGQLATSPLELVQPPRR